MMAQLVRLRPKVLWNALVPPLKNTTYVTLGDGERIYLYQNTVYRKRIYKLPNYYRIAVRASTGKAAEEMRRYIGAALYHCCEFHSERQRHTFCHKTSMLPGCSN